MKVLNDKTFRPMLQDIVARASNGQLKAKADLNIGGHWYRLPNILVEHPTREPWKNVDKRGRVVLQIHFGESYTVVQFSLVLQYNLLTAEGDGGMPEHVSKRHCRICDCLEVTGAPVDRTLPAFKHWNYKQYTLWARPIISHEYRISSLPSDDELCQVLQSLITNLNDAMTIR